MAKANYNDDDWRAKSFPEAGNGVNQTHLPKTKGRDIANNAANKVKGIITNYNVDEGAYEREQEEIAMMGNNANAPAPGAFWKAASQPSDYRDGKTKGELDAEKERVEALPAGPTPNNRVAIQALADYEKQNQPRREGALLTNVPTGSMPGGSYAYSPDPNRSPEDQGAIPLGGWKSQGDMIADNQRRKVTGKLSNGATYTYFLKPGEQAPAEEQQDRFQAAEDNTPGMAESLNGVINRDRGVNTPLLSQDGNQRAQGEAPVITQGSLNQMGAFMAEGKDRDRRETQAAIALNNSDNFKAQQEALSYQLKNSLAQHYMDAGEYDQARSLLSGSTQKQQKPGENWKPFTNKLYDEDGMVTGEETQFYNPTGDAPAIFNPKDSQRYQSALKRVKDGLLVKPELKDAAVKQLKADFGPMFKEEDLT